MTADQFHDALTLLPGELLAGTDRLRRSSAKPRKIPFARYASLAACLALVLFCSWFVHGMFHAKGTASNEAAIQSAQGSWRADPFEAAAPESAETDTAAGAVYPGITLLETQEVPLPRDSAVNYASIVLISAPEDLPEELEFPEDRFCDHDLLLLRLTGFSDAPQLLSVAHENGRWIFTFPDCPSGENNWLLLLEVDKGLIAAEQVDVVFAS